MAEIKAVSQDIDENYECRTIQLKNGLKATLITRLADEHGKEASEEPASFQSSLKLSIDVGWDSDPVEKPGLAHLLQHIIPSSSEEYSELNNFENFVISNGGKYSCCTTAQNTSFFIGINKKHLISAVDKFSELITSSVINEESVTQETEKVERFYQKNSKIETTSCKSVPCTLSYSWTNYPPREFKNLVGSLIGKTHVATKFSRNEAGKIQLITALKEFKEKHYSANRMTLVVEADLPLDTLEQCVKDYFSKVPSNNLPADDLSAVARKNSFNKLYKLKYVKTIVNRPDTEVFLTWLVPVSPDCHKYAPWKYLYHVMDSIVEGTLIDYLKKKKISRGTYYGILSEDYNDSASNFKLISLHFTLWEHDDGFRLKDILDAVFSMINKLRLDEPSVEVFDELKKIEEFRLRYVRQIYPCSKNSVNQHYFTNAPFIEFNPEAIKSFMSALSPDKVNITLIDTIAQKDVIQGDPWGNTNYPSEDIPEAWISEWRNIVPYPEFHLPDPNPFLPASFDSFDLASDRVPKTPKKIYQNDSVELWHSMETRLDKHLCRIAVDVATLPGLCEESVESCVLLDMFVNALNVLRTNDGVNITMVNSFFQYKKFADCVVIEGRCYTGNLSQVLHGALKYVVDCHKLVTKELFDKLNPVDEYSRSNRATPLAKRLLHALIDTSYCLSNDKKTVFEKIDYDQFVNFVQKITKNFYFKIMILTNVNDDVVLDIISENIKSFDVYPKVIQINNRNKEFYEVPLGNTYCEVKNLCKNQSDSSALHYYQILDSKAHSNFIQLNVMLGLLEKITSNRFNDFKKENGFEYWTRYELFQSLERSTKGSFGFTLQVNYLANKFTPNQINKKLDDFVKDIVDELKYMTVDEFDFHKISLWRCENFGCTFYENFLMINGMKLDATCNLDESNRVHNSVNNLTLNEFLAFVDYHIVNNRRKLSVNVVGAADIDTEPDFSDKAYWESENNLTLLTKETDESSEESENSFYINDLSNLNRYSQRPVEFLSCCIWLRDDYAS